MTNSSAHLRSSGVNRLPVGERKVIGRLLQMPGVQDIRSHSRAERKRGLNLTIRADDDEGDPGAAFQGLMG